MYSWGELNMMRRHQVVKCIALFISVMGAVIVVGWVYDIAALKSILPQWASMKFSTAMCFVASGVMLFFMVKAKEGRFTLAQTFIAIATLIITMFMSSLLLFIMLNLKTGIEDLFIQENVLAVFTPMPGRPSVGTMINFSFISISGLVAMINSRRIDKTMFVLACVIFLIGFTAVIGYVLNQPSLYYVSSNVSAGMALHTAILFVCYSCGLYLLYRKEDNIQGASKL